MKILVHSLVAVALTFVVSSPAFACSCIPLTMEERVAEAESIFIGRIIHVLPPVEVVPALPVSGFEGLRAVYNEERVIFVVERVWKGDHKIGDEIAFQGSIFGSMCGMSVRAGPPFFEGQRLEEPVGDEIARVEHSNWLLFTYAGESPSLSLCGGSYPVDVGYYPIANDNMAVALSELDRLLPQEGQP